MALINCPECGRQISDRAPSCPGCGILKEDIQAMIAEKNAVQGVNEQGMKNNNEDDAKSQGTEEEFVGYPTISAISETEKKRYSEKHETKGQKSGQTGKSERKEKSFKVGDVVTFGIQDGEPVSWIILDMKENALLLLSEKCLEVRQYNSDEKSNTWCSSDICGYLNSEFLEKYFSDRERQMIRYSWEQEERFDIGLIELLRDFVFLLSQREIERYFPTRESRVCGITEHVRKQVGEMQCLVADDGTVRKGYWLRGDAGRKLGGPECAECVNDKGDFIDGGLPVNSLCTIRPALVVHLDE